MISPSSHTFFLVFFASFRYQQIYRTQFVALENFPARVATYLAVQPQTGKITLNQKPYSEKIVYHGKDIIIQISVYTFFF